jgi:hypothetical protein
MSLGQPRQVLPVALYSAREVAGLMRRLRAVPRVEQVEQRSGLGF